MGPTASSAPRTRVVAIASSSMMIAVPPLDSSSSFGGSRGSNAAAKVGVPLPSSISMTST